MDIAGLELAKKLRRQSINAILMNEHRQVEVQVDNPMLTNIGELCGEKRFAHGAGGGAAISTASARCFERGHDSATNVSSQAALKGTSPGMKVP